MNILMINGSPHANGNTAVGLAEMKKIFDDEGFETTILQVGDKAIRGCMGCGTCSSRRIVRSHLRRSVFPANSISTPFRPPS